MKLFTVNSPFKATIGNDTHKREITNVHIYEIADCLHTALSKNKILAPNYNALSDDGKVKLACELVDLVKLIWDKTDIKQWCEFYTNAYIYYNDMCDSNCVHETQDLCQCFFNSYPYAFPTKDKCQIQKFLSVIHFHIVEHELDSMPF